MEQPSKSLINIDFSAFRPQKTKKRGQFLRFLIPVVAVLFLLILVYLFLPKQTKDKPSSNKADTKTTTSSVQIKENTSQCKGSKEYKNEKQGYSVCFTSTWNEKDLKTSSLIAGFDQGNFENNFPGTISVTVSDKSEEVSVQDLENNSLKYEFGKATVGKVTGTQIVYTRQTDDPLASFPKGIDTIVTSLGRTYTISLTSNESTYEANEKLYEDFLSSLQFLEDTPNPPWSESRNILLFSPWINDSIESPVEITGEAIAFEAVLNVRIKDSNGHILANAQIKTSSGQERSPFDSKITFENPSTKKGTLEVFTLSAKDGSEQDRVSVTVQFP